MVILKITVFSWMESALTWLTLLSQIGSVGSASGLGLCERVELQHGGRQRCETSHSRFVVECLLLALLLQPVQHLDAVPLHLLQIWPPLERDVIVEVALDHLQVRLDLLLEHVQLLQARTQSAENKLMKATSPGSSIKTGE